MNMKNLITINAPAGILTPNDLIALVQPDSVDGFILGRRQNILIEHQGENYKLSPNVNIDPVPLTHPNIISSHGAGGIDESKTDWAYFNEDYLKALDSFDFRPTISVSICGVSQNLFPLFSSKVNFITSNEEGFWHLVIMLSEERALLPHTLKTTQIAPAVKMIQDLLDDEPYLSSRALAERLDIALHLNENKTLDLELPPLINRDFEGLTTQKNGRMALNIFSNHRPWKKEFIQDFAELAKSQDLNRIYVTAGRSLLLKHISKRDLHSWEKLLGRHNITTRHSEQDLAWVVASHKPQALKLKEQVIRELEKQGFACNGLNIAVDPRDADCGAPIIIYTQKSFMNLSCKVIYKHNFDYRFSGFKTAGTNLNFDQLIDCLRHLQQSYHTLEIDHTPMRLNPINLISVQPEHYQCPDCLSEYHKEAGDPEQDISPGTDFTVLPDSWACPLCECPKENFVAL